MLGATLPEIIWAAGVGSSPALAYVHGTATSNPVVTYDELRALSKVLGQELGVLNLAQKSVVGLLASHSIQTSIALIGVTTSGFTCVPLNPALAHGTIAASLKDAGASVLLVSVYVNF